MQAKYPVLEDKLFLWIDATQRFNMMLPPIVVTRKALSIAADMGILPEDFKASWQWLH